ncbi:hypothetical protein QN345_03485 [Cryobacterium sp. 10I1]|uniref:hypothetical protein n=1 Tax=unclassified Cryobacterium TaxID=2649013 RepID=UPI002AB3F29D|nr:MULTISPECIES: hypothetical protein [unclassified Cryobacterium]MDY7540854.1 hypothetical protein [Cryobacterium sp. 5B3]MEA9999818.1 hypothetical protein [Cryobacterium sp. RTS3]MEB0002468.1 hypothetical protein [Cryobacterium sp. RTC2.1]MEB0203726.1 hypothetical protein [Cryobacterium sp. 5I3]MEB0266605.1 hypothetical protein [Cryobacterium sp. 10I5]
MYEFIPQTTRSTVATVTKINTYLGTIDARSAAQLRAHLADPGTPVMAIRDALAANGFSIGVTAIRTHRHNALLRTRRVA